MADSRPFRKIRRGEHLYLPLQSPDPALLIVPPVALAPSGRFWWALRRVILVAGVWLLVSVPLGIYTFQNAAKIQGHTDDMSILNPVNNHGDAAGALLHGVIATLGAFKLVGTSAAEQNLPYRPILDPVETVFYFVGLAAVFAALVRLLPPVTPESSKTHQSPDAEITTNRPMVAILLIAWILDQSLPSLLSVNRPGFIRMTGVVPALAIVVGLGVGTAYRWLRSRSIPATTVRGAVAICLVISTVPTVRDEVRSICASDSA